MAFVANPHPSGSWANWVVFGALFSRSRRGAAPRLLHPPEQHGPHANPSTVQVWMHRISVFLFVLVSAVAGVLLIILPWTPEWTDNYLLLPYPRLPPLAAKGF